jgi:L-2-hydroxyglutarate oxidase
MYNYIIIGSGIVGLATAYAIKNASPESSILILEKEDGPAAHQTGRNSGVIHSGVYYKPGSKKAELCTRGSQRMITFCRDHGIEYEQCGKVIVATDYEELTYLDILNGRGIENGLKVRRISQNELRELEPHVNGLAALHVPEAGIVNYKKVSEVLVKLLRQQGVEIKFNSHVENISHNDQYCEVQTKYSSFRGGYAINCAGLHSDTLASKSGADLQHQIIPFRGEYYELIEERRHLVKNLIYPVPNPRFPFLGVHFTRMVDGSIHAGPNAVLSLKKEGYSRFSFDASDTWKSLTYPGLWKLAARHWKEGLHELYRSLSKAEFVKSLQKLIPEITAKDLVVSSAGVRAQALNPDGSLVDDFMIKYHGRTIHVCNAPSPAATASLEIGEYITDKVLENRILEINVG